MGRTAAVNGRRQFRCVEASGRYLSHASDPVKGPAQQRLKLAGTHGGILTKASPMKAIARLEVRPFILTAFQRYEKSNVIKTSR